MAVPARLRSQLEKVQQVDGVLFVFCNPVEKCIKIYTMDVWLERGAPVLESISNIYEKHRRQELVYKLLEEQVIDSQGRITLRESFTKAVGIEKEVEVVGTGPSITIKKPETEDALPLIGKEDEEFIASLSI